MWSRICLPYQSTQIHHRFLVGFVLLNLSFLCNVLNISFEFQFHNGLSGLIGHPVLRHVGVAIKRGRGYVIMNTQQRMGMFRHVLRLILNYKAAKQENVYSTEHIHIVHVSYYRKQYCQTCLGE
jgi:hypothetical protein